jgi:hypothetical protein
MPDPIVDFPLRTASQEQLAIALGRCYAEYNTWHGQAIWITEFSRDARMAGVESVMAERIHDAICVAEETGILNTNTMEKSTRQLADELAEYQLTTVGHGIVLAPIVMLHAACELYLWRLVRFGLFANRPQAINWIENREVTIRELVQAEADVLIDEKIESWWNHLERDTLKAKWQRLIALIGYPQRLSSGKWNFDEELLLNFDKVRHSAVHRDWQAVAVFDFTEFATQLQRAQLVWMTEIAMRLDLKIPAEVLFGLA